MKKSKNITIMMRKNHPEMKRNDKELKKLNFKEMISHNSTEIKIVSPRLNDFTMA